MKKQLLLLVLTLLPMMAMADAVEIDGIYYYLIDKIKNAEVTINPNRYIGNIDIPESITYDGISYSVTSIGSLAFTDCSGLTSVTIPNSVTSIGDYAFQDCSELSSVTIPNSVTTIGIYAFYGCSSLTCISIPQSVASIGSAILYGCDNLTLLELHCKEIGPSWFRGLNSIQEVVLGDEVTAIGDYAFWDCSNLTTFRISDLGAWINMKKSNLAFSTTYSLYLNDQVIEDLVIPENINFTKVSQVMAHLHNLT